MVRIRGIDAARQRGADAVKKRIAGGEHNDRAAAPNDDRLHRLFKGLCQLWRCARSAVCGEFQMAGPPNDRELPYQALGLVAETGYTVFSDTDHGEPGATMAEPLFDMSATGRPRILILGETTEARQLAERLVLRTALRYGDLACGVPPTPPAAVPTRIGGFGGPKVAAFLRRNEISPC